jgi:uncharacterized repeat protein (TIGR03803 family)
MGSRHNAQKVIGLLSAAIIAFMGMIGLPTPAARQASYAVLHGFTLPPGSPTGALIQGADGAFYGTTVQGGTSNHGTVFKMDASGVDHRGDLPGCLCPPMSEVSIQDERGPVAIAA